MQINSTSRAGKYAIHGSVLRNVLNMLILGLLVGCGAVNRQACGDDGQLAVQELLYFGTATPSGRVTPDAWTQFIGEIITPHFPEGLSVWQASGQWQSASGEVIREPSYVLSLVHPDDATARKAVLEIIASYKTRFHQEAVLRVKTPACKSF
jgi:hypothetical protein